ncbi:MAG: ATP-binding protein [Gammaproteobacteria bacterium]
MRSQVFLLLFLFSLAPLIIAIAINVPLVFDRLEHFYHSAHLQQLRWDFHPLDQHITRRKEMLRLLAKFPDPLLNNDLSSTDNPPQLSQQRTNYLGWVNQALFNDLDIKEIIFIDNNTQPVFWLHREKSSGIFIPGKNPPDLTNKAWIESGLKVKPGSVLTSPITLKHTSDDPILDHFMTVRFIAPIVAYTSTGQSENPGAVMFVMDVGGIARAHPDTWWVQNNGKYLETPNNNSTSGNAFQDFPGLQALLKTKETALWERADQQVFWLPFFPSEDEGPLWVGRTVDPSPINDFSSMLKTRILLILAGLLTTVLLIARWIALRTERISQQLSSGISNMLETEQAPSFNWKQPNELHTLGSNLNSLGKKHVSTIQLLQKHTQELEESNRYKSEFLANVSHELRTPLNSIVLLSKLLANKKDPQFTDDNKSQAIVIYSAGRDLRMLIDSILNLAKAEAGELSVDPQPIHCRQLLQEIVDLLQPQFSDQQHKFELVIDPQAPDTLITDSSKLRQILLNFLSNAIKFTEQGNIRLVYALNTGNDQQTHPVVISVTDTGVGIPEDRHDDIFEAFKQVDGTTQRRYGGTGLGLTISKELAQLLGGYITLESEIGKGSVFSVILPLEAPVSSNTDQTKLNDTEDVSLPIANYHGKRILLVDDDLRNLLALTPILENWNIEVIAAGDGQEALDTLAENADQIDLVLMDLMMPAMDGYETTQKIRRDERFTTLPIIAISAKAEDAELATQEKRLLNDFIPKPVDPAKLKSILDHYLVNV